MGDSPNDPLRVDFDRQNPVRDVEADLAACREWVGALVGAVPRREVPEVAEALRGLLTAGVRRVAVRWRADRQGRRNRHIPEGGVVELHGPHWRALRQLNAWENREMRWAARRFSLHPSGGRADTNGQGRAGVSPRLCTYPCPTRSIAPHGRRRFPAHAGRAAPPRTADPVCPR